MLDGFCDETQGFRAALRCGRNRAAHTTSGIRRSFAAKTIPSVGTGAVGFTTIVGQINLVLMLEVTPMEISVGTSDEDSVSSRRPIFNVNLRSAITLPDEQGIHVRSEVTEIDRVAIGAFVVETTCRVEQGRPTIAGTLTIPPGQSWLGNGDAQREVVHVVLLTNSAE